MKMHLIGALSLGVALAAAIAGLTGPMTAQAAQSSRSAAQQNSTPAQPPQSAAQAGNRMKIAPGSVIPVQLTKGIDAKKAKAGEEVYAQVTEDLKAGNGEVIVPKDTKITGKITEAQARNKQEKESQLGIAFDHATMKDGADVALPMSIQAVIAPSYLSGNNNNNAANSQPQSNSQGSAASGGMSQGRSTGMNQPQNSNPATAGGEEPATASGISNHPPITGKTEGVLGMEHVTLSSAPNATQGSVLSSEKGNVKLEGGTLMLLRVNR